MADATHDDDASSSTRRASDEPTLRDGFTPLQPKVDALDRAAVLGAVQQSLLGASSGPTRIGRYAILRQLGSGGMGVVYAAYDEDLERRIAIKLLRNDVAEPPDPSSAEDRARLRTEARALARLSHPNVVTVHEVGEHEGRIYLAMEYVRGRTLAEWVEGDKRRWPDVIEVFRAAGRGLAAAHAVGLVHRDFKPGNVMVGDDGSVKVMDFGLARQHNTESDDAPKEVAAGDVVDTPLTRTGTLLGTPAFMSPEQFAAAEVGPASDQFSFCLSLYQALYGQRPFEGATVGELAAAVLGRDAREPPAETDVPRRVHDVVMRGLAVEPQQRFENMEALLAALTPPRRARSGTVAWLGGATVGIGLLVALGQSSETPVDPCAEAGAAAETAWSPQRADSVERTLSGVDTFVDVPRVLSSLDAYATVWGASRVDACEATHVRREQSPALLDLRMACLDRRLAGFDALVGELEGADAKVASQAVMSVTRLPGVSRCGDADYLQAEVKPPDDPAKAAEVAALMNDVARLDALVATAQYDAALASVDELLARVEPLQHPPLSAQVHYARGGILQELGNPDDAAAALEQAFFGAVGVGDRDRAVLAASRLVFVYGVRNGDIDVALQWTKHGEAWAAGLAPTDPLRALLSTAVGNALGDAGRYEEAASRLRDAISSLDGSDQARPLWVANALHNLGDVLYRRGEFEAAAQVIDRAYEVRVTQLGPTHPFVASTLTSQGTMALQAGDLDRAADLYQRAAGIQEKALGPGNPTLAGTVANLGVVLKRQGRYEDARREIERARGIFHKALGPDHPAVAQALDLLAGVAIEQERYDEARVLLVDALRISESALGPEHPKVLSAVHNLGEVALAQRQWDEAAGLFERAASGREAKLGPEHPWLAQSLRGLGLAWRGLGERSAALEALQRASQVCAASECDVAAELAAEIASLRPTPAPAG